MRSYKDPTADSAIGNTYREQLENDKFKKCIATIRYICDLAGFKIEGRIALRSKKTGRIWR